jgi:D-arabinose 1-dehydrogenase-like Zn-dependent alcohol dehydrogenase
MLKFRGGFMTTTAIAIATMKVAQVSSPGADFRIVEREIPEPGVGHVRIKVQACGVCHSDVLTKEGLWPGIQYPRVPGHEVAGTIDELGAGVPSGRRGSASVSAGMAGRTARVASAGAEIFAIAEI